MGVRLRQIVYGEAILQFDASANVDASVNGPLGHKKPLIYVVNSKPFAQRVKYCPKSSTIFFPVYF